MFKCKNCNKEYKYRKSYFKHVDQKCHLKPVSKQNLHFPHVDNAINSLFIKAGLLLPPRQSQNDDIIGKIYLNNPKKLEFMIERIKKIINDVINT